MRPQAVADPRPESGEHSSLRDDPLRIQAKQYGSFGEPDESIGKPDGSIGEPDGSTGEPDGSVGKPDGSIG